MSWAGIDDVVEHVYVHVPFCPTICPFCSFEVLERRAGAVDAYLDRIDAEAAATAARLDVRPRTVYFGGGTPSYLREVEFEWLCAIVERHFGRATDEVTLEAHPATLTPARARAWRDLGVTRLSVGVESTDDAVLRRLGRSHDARAALAALDVALASGLEVSVDVMTAIEGQDVAADLARVAVEGVDHFSAYTLTVEEGTPFHRDGVEVDAEAEWAALDAAERVLAGAGLERYEVSNHARPGHECRHNLAYWDNRCWVGIGPGAHAHEPAEAALETASGSHAERDALTVRRANPGWAEWLDDRPPDLDPRDPEGWAIDALIAGLRRRDGVDLAELSARAGFDVARHFDARLAVQVADSLLVRTGDRVRATTRGLRLLDQVVGSFVVAEPAPASSVATTRS